MNTYYKLCIISLLLLIFIFNGSIYSQESIIPDDRIIEWSPGIQGGIPDYPVGVNITDYGAIGDDTTDDTQALLDAIEACPENHAVFIPAGEYVISERIFIQKSIVIRGDGIDETYLIFEGKDDGEGGYDAAHFWIGGYNRSDPINVNSGFNKGSNQITINDTSGLSVDDVVVIRQTNDPDVMIRPQLWYDITDPEDENFYRGWTWGDHPDYPDRNWGKDAVGQFLIIEEIDGNTLTLNRPLYYDYNLDYDPYIIHYTNPTRNAGIENLNIELIHNSNAVFGNIQLYGAVNCWVRNIKSYKCSRSHVQIENSMGCVVKNNYFEDSHSYAGGYGYGVCLMYRTTDCLIENNIIYKHHGALVASVGVCGNVFAYNFAAKPMDDAGEFAVLHPGVSAHGHHPYMNLYEGNSTDNAFVDFFWGDNTQFTFLRNIMYRSDGYSARGVPVEVDQNNPFMSFVGNILHHENSVEGGAVWELPDVPDYYPDTNHTYNTLIRHGNYDYMSENVFWESDIESQTIPNSYYLDEKPAFFTDAIWGDTPWPIIGPDLSTNGIIPAQQRYCEMNNILVPETPANLLGSVMNNHISLSWTDNSDNEDGFKIYQSFDGTNFERAEVTLPDSISYTIVGLKSNTTYYFKICSFNHFSGCSSFSNTVSVTTEEGSEKELLAWYKFDDDAADSSGNAYDGSISGAELTNGRIDQGYLFDGLNDTIIISSWDDPLNGNEQAFAITAWINPYKLDEYNFVLSDGTNYGNFLFGLQHDRPFIHYFCYEPDGGYQRYSLMGIESGKVKINTFSHIAITYEPINNVVRLYTNGQQVAIDRINRPWGSPGIFDLFIGCGSRYNEMDYYEGIIDDIRIYKSYLSADDIFDIYLEGLPPETNPPTVPENLHSSAISGSDINLTWDASTDESGLAGYMIYRDDSLIAQVEGQSYSDTGLQEYETYAYTIVAIDIFGNRSEASSEFSETTMDITPPSVPTGLTGSAISEDQIDIEWTASIDNAGVAGYLVYRNGEQIADVNELSYSDDGLEPNTEYAYTILSYDEAENESDFSGTINITTLDNIIIENIDLSNSGYFKVYPNPANSILIIENALDTPLLFELFDLRGIKILHSNVETIKQEIEISDIDEGVYLYKISSIDKQIYCGIICI
ncbi:LamG-like jellyroll fold domain-containing protein, partial [Bacteroidota bacterium]